MTHKIKSLGSKSLWGREGETDRQAWFDFFPSFPTF